MKMTSFARQNGKKSMVNGWKGMGTIFPPGAVRAVQQALALRNKPSALAAHRYWYAHSVVCGVGHLSPSIIAHCHRSGTLLSRRRADVTYFIIDLNSITSSSYVSYCNPAATTSGLTSSVRRREYHMYVRSCGGGFEQYAQRRTDYPSQLRRVVVCGHGGGKHPLVSASSLYSTLLTFTYHRTYGRFRGNHLSTVSSIPFRELCDERENVEKSGSGFSVPLCVPVVQTAVHQYTCTVHVAAYIWYGA